MVFGGDYHYMYPSSRATSLCPAIGTESDEMLLTKTLSTSKVGLSGNFIDKAFRTKPDSH